MAPLSARNQAPAAIASQYLPWPALAAIVVSLVCLWFSLGPNWLIPVLALALASTYLTPARIGPRWLAWLAGLLAIGIVMGSDWGAISQAQMYGINPPSVEVIALIALAVLAVVCWVRQTDRAALSLAIFLSGFAFLLGCTTWDVTFIRFAAPAYMFFAILSFPGFRAAVSAGREGRAAASALRAAAVLAAILAGAGVYAGFWVYRAQLTALGDRFLQNRHVPESAGVSLNPVLGDSFGLAGSPARVMEIAGPLLENHLRGLTFDTYSFGGWHGGLYAGPTQSATPQSLDSDSAGPRAEITCLADTAGIVYTPLHAAGIALPAGVDSALWTPQTGAAIRTRSVPPYHYAVIGGEEPLHQGPLCMPPNPAELRLDLAIPSGLDPGVRRLALKIGSGLTTPQAKIAAVIGYLQGHYTYSLTIHPGPGDPVSNFLLHRKAAYCEYFASAAVILLRYLHVPSRYVVGYYAHESDGPNTIVVRQWDSHAWAESWVNGVGWETVDATPGDGLPDQINHPFWTRIWERIEDALATLHGELARLSPVQIAAIAGGVVLASLLVRELILFALRASRRRRARRVPAGYTERNPEMRAMAARFHSYLIRARIACASDSTWREAIERVAASGADASFDREAALAFIREYNAARFGGQADPAGVDSLRETLRTLEEGSLRR